MAEQTPFSPGEAAFVTQVLSETAGEERIDMYLTLIKGRSARRRGHTFDLPTEDLVKEDLEGLEASRTLDLHTLSTVLYVSELPREQAAQRFLGTYRRMNRAKLSPTDRQILERDTGILREMLQTHNITE